MRVKGTPLNGFLHAGGVLADALVPNQTMTGVKAVFGAKVSPNPIHQFHSLYLDNLLAASQDDCSVAQVGALDAFSRALHQQPLGQMHLFSSISADVGNAGQSNYAAANAAVAALADKWAHQVPLSRSAMIYLNDYGLISFCYVCASAVQTKLPHLYTFSFWRNCCY